MRVTLRNLQDRPVLSTKGLVTIAELVREHDGADEGAAAVAFVGDATMCEYHGRFMSDPSTTDVLSFADDPGDYWGDIVVCTDQALRQAVEIGHPYPYELAVLVLHGLLHLRGYDHTTDAGEMSRLEEALRPLAVARGGLR